MAILPTEYMFDYQAAGFIGLRIRSDTGLDGELEEVTADRGRGINITRITGYRETPRTTAQIPVFLAVGATFDIQPYSKVYIDVPEEPDGLGRAPRVGRFWVMNAPSTIEAGVRERNLVLDLVDDYHLIQFPPLHPAYPWPPGEGTPYVDTYTFQSSISAGSSITVSPVSTKDMYAGKWLSISYPDLTGFERVQIASVNYTGNTTVAAAVTATGATTVTPASMTGITNGTYLQFYNADNTNVESALVSNVTGTTFDVTLTKTKRAGWGIRAGRIVLADVSTAKTYAETTVALATARGEQTVTPAAMPAQIYVGQIVTVRNADGTAQEDVEVTAVTGTTFTATFLFAHTAGWKVEVRPRIYGGLLDLEFLKDGWYQDVDGALMRVYGYYDTFFMRSQSTTVPLAVATGSQTVTPVTMQNITVGRELWVEDANGSNVEKVTVTAVGTGTFTATFALAHSANWVVYNGMWIDKDALTEVLGGHTMGVLKFGVGVGTVSTFEAGLQELQKRAFPIDTEVTATLTAGANVWVTPKSMYGIAVAKYLDVKNADGTNAERVRVEEVTRTQFKADFGSNKSADWVIRGEVLSTYGMSTIPANALGTALWTPQALWYDSAVKAQNTTLTFTNVIANEATDAAYQDYTLNRDATEKFNRQQVVGSASAYGDWVDWDAVEDLDGPQRIIAGPPLQRTDILSNESAELAGRAAVRSAWRDRDTVQNIQTEALIDSAIFRSIRSCTFRHTWEPDVDEADPEPRPLTRVEMRLDGSGTHWAFTLGEKLFGAIDTDPVRNIPAPTVAADRRKAIVLRVSADYELTRADIGTILLVATD